MTNAKLQLTALVAVLMVAGVRLSGPCDRPQERANQPAGCDLPPQALLHKPRREYKGFYQNMAYGYSVVIPKGFVGYDDVNPSYQRGFGIIFGEEPQGYIVLYGEHNSVEDDSAMDRAQRELGYRQEDRIAIISSKITPTNLGQLPAAQLLVTYTCPGLPERRVWFSTIALSPDKLMAYEVTLHTLASRFDHDHAVLNQLVGSWKYIGPR
ncbi:MAG: hypothetical protein ABSF45_25455 [Terriglobia bacterium]|jgi:hypothetical protein